MPHQFAASYMYAANLCEIHQTPLNHEFNAAAGQMRRIAVETEQTLGRHI